MSKLQTVNRISSIRILAATVMLATAFIFMIGGSIIVKAGSVNTEDTSSVYYKSITVEEGESLWSIAQDYTSGTDAEIYDYITDVKDLNGLTSDELTSGQNIIVLYYQ